MSTRSTASENTGMKRLLKPVAISILIGAVCCAVVLLLMAVIVSSRNVPQFAIDPMAIFALCVGGLAAGLCCARIVRENGLACGALCGAVLAAIVLLCGLAMRDNGFGVPALFKIIFVMLSSMLGGVLGVNTRRRRK